MKKLNLLLILIFSSLNLAVSQCNHASFESASTSAPPGSTNVINISASSVVTASRPVISNRYLLANQLQNIYVAKSNPTADDTKIQTLITNLVLNHPEAFGGNCSRNDPGCVPKPCGLAGGLCFGQLSTSQFAETLPTAGVVRKAYTIQVCEQILTIDQSVTNLLANFSLSLAIPNSTTVTSLLQSYYPGKIPSSETVAKLLVVSQAAAQNGMSVIDQWRFLILPVCESIDSDLQ